MDKALTKLGSSWISKKAKEEISNISSLSNSVEVKAKLFINKLKGKSQVKPLPDLLREHNLPPGLFPRNIICYEFDEAKGKLVVHLSSPCEVCFKDSSIVRYANRVKGTLSKGKLTLSDGMKTKVLVWVKVTSVVVESYKSDKVWFNASGVKKSRPKDAYEMPREAIKVEHF
ncbi:uncharacterized protein At5g01610-like [Lotus japonicus]|uniref:uncharacterized protein At5g01610-like n=1 Tax=Lotus japonicus TaxID=34305 RepID=UPI00258B6630|nr:uncharacterized protein At5g01610-like [Lotus japonicus]XP_057420507.1 uncharacterized protein At5g01610-like [Lotus japonicus]